MDDQVISLSTLFQQSEALLEEYHYLIQDALTMLASVDSVHKLRTRRRSWYRKSKRAVYTISADDKETGLATNLS